MKEAWKKLYTQHLGGGSCPASSRYTTSLIAPFKEQTCRAETPRCANTGLCAVWPWCEDESRALAAPSIEMAICIPMGQLVFQWI